MKIADHQLCYIEGGKAYFADVPPERVWGDDWDDAPYEHNAERPYDHEKGDLDKKVNIIACMFDGPVETPEDISGGNSRYSVEAINKGAIAWLHPSWGAKEERYIHAGTTVREFIKGVEAMGGTVYVSLDWVGDVSFLREEG